ncbi:hypothetical protein PAMP_018739 [Pampus punctatissimus]
MRDRQLQQDIHREKSYESQTEDESSRSPDTFILSSTQPNVSKEVDLTESTEEEKKHITEKHIISVERGLSQEEELSDRLPVADVQSDELSGTEEEKDPSMTTLDQVDRAANEKDDSSVPDQDLTQSELEPADLSSFSGISNGDVCAQELGTAEGVRDETFHKEKTLVDNTDIEDSEGEESIDVREPVEAFPYSGLADMNVCATELGEMEKTMEDATVDDEETVVQSSLSQSETLEGKQEVEDQADKTKEEEGAETEASSGETRETLGHIEGSMDSNAIPNEETLVEINFEDIQEAQQITEKKTVDEGSEKVKMQKPAESIEVAAVVTDQNISGADLDEPEMEEVLKEVNTEREEMENQQAVSNIMEEKADANDPDFNDSDDDNDDEKGESVKNILSFYQATTEADEESPENKTDHKIEDNEIISESESDQNEDSEKQTKSNDPDINEDEIEDTAGEDTEGHSEMKDKEMSDGNVENNSLQVTQPNISKAGMEAESETLQASAQNLPEETEVRALVESQLEDTEELKEVTSKETTSEAEELVEEGKIDSKVQEKSDAMCISPTQSTDQATTDHQGEQRPHGSGKDTPQSDGQKSDKVAYINKNSSRTCLINSAPHFFSPLDSLGAGRGVWAAIPAGIRGMEREECNRPQEEEDIMDIPLDDPEANRAAAKIQAGFRGHMTRKKMKPEDKAEGEEVSSTGDVLNGSQGDTETGGSGPVEGDDTSVPEQ